ncbi:MAG: hypothetical protein NVS9B1_14300 [Candidatus Dormibacteraceae bacterium]
MTTTREFTFALLVLQAGVGLLTALGATVAAIGGFPGDALLAAAALSFALGQVTGAVLIARGSRRAATLIAIYEGVALFGATIGSMLQLGTDAHLAPWVTNIALPAALLALTLRLRGQATHRAGAATR